MIESPEISVISESWRQLRQTVEGVGDIWRHEGLKKGVEFALHATGGSTLGQWALRELCQVSLISAGILVTDYGGLQLDGPTGLAAGWDKTGKTILAWQALGANHITVGGVPYYPQAGNRMVRLRTFDNRVGDHGTSRSLNAYGFYSPGAKKVTYNIARQREAEDVFIPVIVQVTANKEMYEESQRPLLPAMLSKTVKEVRSVADGIGIGLTSPNTIGMREAQDQWDFTYANVMAVVEAADGLPVTFKGDGDGGKERLDMYCRLVETTGVNLELINTTARADIKARYGAEELPGGLAGADPEYQQMAIDAVKYVYEQVGDKTSIMGVGGINSKEQALKMLGAGASALAINTAIREAGPGIINRVDRGIYQTLDTLVQSKKIYGLAQLIGSSTQRGPKI